MSTMRTYHSSMYAGSVMQGHLLLNMSVVNTLGRMAGNTVMSLYSILRVKLTGIKLPIWGCMTNDERHFGDNCQLQ